MFCGDARGFVVLPGLEICLFGAHGFLRGRILHRLRRLLPGLGSCLGRSLRIRRSLRLCACLVDARDLAGLQFDGHRIPAVLRMPRLRRLDHAWLRFSSRPPMEGAGLGSFRGFLGNSTPPSCEKGRRDGAAYSLFCVLLRSSASRSFSSGRDGVTAAGPKAAPIRCESARIRAFSNRPASAGLAIRSRAASAALTE